MQEKTNNKIKENKNTQNLKMEIESTRKTQAERILKIRKNRNSNKTNSGKPHQQNTKDRRKNFRCQSYKKRNGNTSQRND